MHANKVDRKRTNYWNAFMDNKRSHTYTSTPLSDIQTQRHKLSYTHRQSSEQFKCDFLHITQNSSVFFPIKRFIIHVFPQPSFFHLLFTSFFFHSGTTLHRKYSELFSHIFFSPCIHFPCYYFFWLTPIQISE